MVLSLSVKLTTGGFTILLHLQQAKSMVETRSGVLLVLMTTAIDIGSNILTEV